MLRNRLMRPLVRLRDSLSRVRDMGRRRGVTLAELQRELSPVFVIGANRSGTSVVSAILSQHDELEALFGDDAVSRTDEAGHSIGFAESMHVWMALAPDERPRRRNRQLPYWALPQYVNQTYRNRARDNSERFELAWSLQRLRRTDRQPVLKDQFNTLRIGLIVDVFPQARFVLVTRDFERFAERGFHKWSNDGSGTLFSEKDPRAGLHWLMTNIIARYDLESYAPGRYAQISLDAIQFSRAEAQKAFDSALSAIGLAPFAFDYRLLDSRWSGSKSEEFSLADDELKGIKRIVDLERTVLAGRNRAVSDASIEET